MTSSNRLPAALVSALLLAGCAAQVSGDQANNLAVSPPSATVPPNGTAGFTAIGSAVSTDVTWSVEQGSPAGGTVGPTSGATTTYTAPATTGTYSVRATLTTNSAIFARATVTVSNVPPADIIPADRRTVWSPGIPGGTPDSRGYTVHTTLSTVTAASINSAIQSAGAVATAGSPRVVQLPSGTFNINGQITMDQPYVVLRGAGPMPGTTSGSGTRLVMTQANTDMFFMGAYATWGAAKNVSAVGGGDIPKGSNSFTVTGGGVQAGDLLVIDMDDDADVTLEGGNWYKRCGGNTDNGPAVPTPLSANGGCRSRGQLLEVASVSGNDVTIVGVIHRAYPRSLRPQVFGSSDVRSGFAGIALENMTITGWGDAFGIYANWLKRSWIKNVEFDGWPSSQTSFGHGPYTTGVGTGTQGVDIRWFRSVRCAMEHNYLHHSRVYETNNQAYSISLAQQTSDTLIQDNIVWFKNKNVTLEASGAGNVVAYNYLDDPVIASSGTAVMTNWLEMCMDGTHIATPSFDLFEGNYVSKMGAAETHGNATDQTFFRNYSKGNRLYALSDNEGVAAVMLNRYMNRMNFVGNVLTVRGAGSNAVYEQSVSGTTNTTPMGTPKIWSIGLDGYNGNWDVYDPATMSTLLRVGNYDYVRNRIDTMPTETVPDSLYLVGKPAFFGSYQWPWVDAAGTTKLYTLPAQARWAAGTPMIP